MSHSPVALPIAWFRCGWPRSFIRSSVSGLRSLTRPFTIVVAAFQASRPSGATRISWAPRHESTASARLSRPTVGMTTLNLTIQRGVVRPVGRHLLGTRLQRTVVLATFSVEKMFQPASNPSRRPASAAAIVELKVFHCPPDKSFVIAANLQETVAADRHAPVRVHLVDRD